MEIRLFSEGFEEGGALPLNPWLDSCQHELARPSDADCPFRR